MTTLIRVLLIAFLSFLVWVIYQKDTGATIAVTRIIEGIPNGDKLGHFLLMGTLTILGVLASQFHRFKFKETLQIYSASLIIFVVITLEEFSQLFLESRTFEWLDMTANTAGIVLFSLLAAVIERLVQKKRKQLQLANIDHSQ